MPGRSSPPIRSGVSRPVRSQTFRADTTPPAGFRLRAPAKGSTLWSPSPRLSWRRSSDHGSGLSGYEVVIDGKIAAFTRRTSYTPSAGLSEGRHSWQVIAVDRVGNQRDSATWHFRIASARLAPASRTAVLHSGLVVQDFCARGCRVQVSVRFGTRAVALSTTRHFRRGGIERLALSLPQRPGRRPRRAAARHRDHRQRSRSPQRDAQPALVDTPAHSTLTAACSDRSGS